MLKKRTCVTQIFVIDTSVIWCLVSLSLQSSPSQHFDNFINWKEIKRKTNHSTKKNTNNCHKLFLFLLLPQNSWNSFSHYTKVFFGKVEKHCFLINYHRRFDKCCRSKKNSDNSHKKNGGRKKRTRLTKKVKKTEIKLEW